MNKSYTIAQVAVDPVIFTIKDKKLKVFLQIREKEPFKDKKELPGGLLLQNETAEETLNRKLKEILGYSELFFNQFYTFTEPNRDPRSRTISIGFITLINPEKIKNFKDWYDYNALKDIAFDHPKIIQKAREFIKKQANHSLLKHIVPSKFPLNKLQEVYETIEEKKYDNRNFRKKILSLEILEETKQKEQSVSHRPAKLFKFK